MTENLLLTLQIATLAVMLIGLIGLIIPVLPGLVIIWIVALVYYLVVEFSWPTGIAFAVLTLLMVTGSLIDNFVMGASARMTGASWKSIGAALIAGIIGSLVFPPFGGLIAALLALILVEYLRLRDIRKAWASAYEMAQGCGWSVVVRVLIGFIMVLIWVISAFGFPPL
jgi:hypothetical protein